MSELLIGCGRSRAKLFSVRGDFEWRGLVTLDIEPAHEPDVVHDLESLPLPFADDQFDEIHAYDVLEHTGRQGDWRFFFAQWAEFHRILKPDGLFYGVVPCPDSPWAFGDPSHTRVIPIQQLGFLAQSLYEQVGTTNVSDFRAHWRGNLELMMERAENGRQMFILQKVGK